MILLSPTELFSIILNIILFIWGIIQLVNAKREDETTRSKVRIWHKHIEGIKNALLQIGQNPNRFTNKEDIASTVQTVAQSAVALDDAFAEDRFYKDDELKVKRETSEKETKALLKKLRRPQPVNSKV